ncbi:unnamed protein product [Rotaria sordida]|uniref:Uncharacterized protein n=1 Tax=Rotaria sordida TaxID=392033 RepID=A0A819M910_9BILA|nr:unnamed protein product [Rotaria sordida]
MILLDVILNLCLRSNGDLNSLSSDDRSILLLKSADSVLCLSGIFILRQSQLNICRSFLNVLHTKYGEQCLSYTIPATKLIDPNFVLTNIALSLLLFSTNICVFSSKLQEEHVDANRIFRIQNRYAEITWTYLLYRYDHHDVVWKFVNFIQCLLVVIQT